MFTFFFNVFCSWGSDFYNSCGFSFFSSVPFLFLCLVLLSLPGSFFCSWVSPCPSRLLWSSRYMACEKAACTTMYRQLKEKSDWRQASAPPPRWYDRQGLPKQSLYVGQFLFLNKWSGKCVGTMNKITWSSRLELQGRDTQKALHSGRNQMDL